MLHPVPFLLHAFAISLAGARWQRLQSWRRAAVLATMVLAIAPVVVAASSYHADGGADSSKRHR